MGGKSGMSTETDYPQQTDSLADMAEYYGQYR